VLNLNGHSILCQNSSGCSTAVSAHGGTGTVKNGTIAPSPSGPSGSWQTGVDVTSYNNITNITVENATDGIIISGIFEGNISGCVFKNISDACIATTSGGCFGFYNSATAQNNYCSSAADGIVVADGPIYVGGPDKINSNYLDVSGGSGAGIETATSSGCQAGTYADDVQVNGNIVSGGTPPISTGGSVAQNICSDTGTCPLPGSNFSLSVSFTP
jgi:hypothetical protein